MVCVCFGKQVPFQCFPSGAFFSYWQRTIRQLIFIYPRDFFIYMHHDPLPSFFWIGYASNFIMEGQIGLSTKQAQDLLPKEYIMAVVLPYIYSIANLERYYNLKRWSYER